MQAAVAVRGWGSAKYTQILMRCVPSREAPSSRPQALKHQTERLTFITQKHTPEPVHTPSLQESLLRHLSYTQRKGGGVRK